jgi:hypothetical protein
VKFAAWLGALTLLSGCAVWDQDVFQPSPEAPPVVTPPIPAPRADARTPLVSIDYAEPSPVFRDPLRYAIRSAEARGRGVRYDVVAVVASAEGLAEGRARAAQVMRAMTEDRVAAARINLGLRVDPAAGPGRVLIYVR